MLFCFVMVTILMLFMNNNIKAIRVVNFSYWAMLIAYRISGIMIV